LGDNIRQNVLTKGCILYSEIEFLIRQELRETALYNTIMEAVALGNTRLNEIQNKTQIDKAKISVYLKNLMGLEIIAREFSVLSGAQEQAASTRGIYRLTDNFFRFWFSFVSLNLSELESGDVDGIYRYAVLPQLHEFASLAFESVCREYLRRQNRLDKLPFHFTKIGRWWGKAQRSAAGKPETYETEIDVMAVDQGANNFLVGECKFRTAAMDWREYRKLAEKLPPAAKSAPHYIYLFSKSGFTPEMLDFAARSPEVHCLTLHDVISGTAP
jgi:AAA+ ATPase superfamily predicted ATPase